MKNTKITVNYANAGNGQYLITLEKDAFSQQFTIFANNNLHELVQRDEKGHPIPASQETNGKGFNALDHKLILKKYGDEFITAYNAKRSNP